MDLTDPGLTAAAVIGALDLRPHPEGGHYRETFRDAPADGGRGAATAILFLLAEGERSHWHRVDAAEVWLWHAGAPLRLMISPDAMGETAYVLGPRLGATGGPHEATGSQAGTGSWVGAGPQAVVPARCWQAAESLGGWTLASCVVAPAFRFSGFELAPPGWRPGAGGAEDAAANGRAVS